MHQQRLTAEFLLTAASCEWPRSAARDERLRELAAAGVDWEVVLSLARRHRVEGLLHRAFSEAGLAVPAAVSEALAQTAAVIGTQTLLQSAESARLQRLLQDDGIDCLFVKGVPLAAIAYGTLGVKQAWDIDLVVAPDDAGPAMSVLRAAGYKRSYPGPDVSEERLLDWAAISKETLWMNHQNGMVVELHTEVVDNPTLLPGLLETPPVQRVAIGSGIELKTLGTDALFAYLCVHGAFHGWMRLKWLADVAALLRTRSPAGTERLYRAALELGAGRSAAQALLLSSRLLALPLPAQLERELKRERANQWLERLGLAAMAGRGAVELDDTLFGTVVINTSHFLLGRGWRYKYAELARKTVNPQDRFAMPLPRPLHFLYPVLAVPNWLWRRYKVSRGQLAR